MQKVGRKGAFFFREKEDARYIGSKEGKAPIFSALWLLSDSEPSLPFPPNLRSECSSGRDVDWLKSNHRKIDSVHLTVFRGESNLKDY